MKKDPWKVKLLNQIKEKGLAYPLTEQTFMYSRNWKFDYLWKEEKIAIEYQGGMFIKKHVTGHNSIRGQSNDWEKFNEAQIRGYMIICVNPKTIDNGTAIDQIVRALKVRRNEIRYE